MLHALPKFGFILTLGLCAAWPTLAAEPRATPAPSIVFFLVDDLDRELFKLMPRLQTMLTDRGTTFDQHFVTISLCCPSRAATLRGQFAVNNGMYGNEMPTGGFQLFYEKGLEKSTLATWLRSAGYRTVLLGKYLNEYPVGAPSTTYIPPGWSEWASPIDGTPYGSFNYTMNQNGTPVAYGSGPNDHITDVISRLSVDFIRRATNRDPTQPMFMYIAPYAPHAPATPPARYASNFPDVKVPRTPSFNEADVSDKPEWVRNLPLLTSTQISDMDELYRNRRRSMLGVEDLVQNVIDALQAQGRLDNTYIFFASDNGYHMGQHRMDSGKNTAFEEDLVVPLVVRGPGVRAGRVVQRLTANVDYAGTFAEIAGVRPPSFVDGRSLMPFINGSSVTNWRRALLLEHQKSLAIYNRQGGLPATSTAEPMDAFDITPLDMKVGVFRGLRTSAGQTYLEYKAGDFELYDNLADPFQLVNTYPTSTKAVKDRMANWVKVLQSSSGQAMRTAEEAPPGQ